MKLTCGCTPSATLTQLERYGTAARLKSRPATTAPFSTSGIDFLIAEKLAPGTYYVSVGSANDATTGAYTLHTSIAGAVSVDTDATGDISQAGELDFFKLDLSNNTGIRGCLGLHHRGHRYLRVAP